MCAMCRHEFPDDLIENPTLLRPIESSLDAGFEDGHQWFYEGRNGMYRINIIICSRFSWICSEDSCVRREGRIDKILIGNNFY